MFRYFFFAVLALFPAFSGRASVPDSSGVAGLAYPTDQGYRLKKQGLAGQIRAMKALRRHQQATASEPEPASQRARTALVLYIGSYALGMLGSVSFLFSLLFLAGFLTSIVLAILILAKERNPRSRRIARWILIISGAMVLSAAILLAVLLYYFQAH